MKKLASLALAGVMTLGLLAGCGGDDQGSTPGGSGEPNTSTDQTEFKVLSGISALSGGYADNPVLNDMMKNAGITIDWEVMSDSIGEQVNIRINGDQLPDAFQAVGFSNYDLGRYGRGGTFIDLTPYVTDPEVMPNLSKILEEYPSIKAAITQDDGKIYGLPAGEMMGTAAVGAEDEFAIYAVPQFSVINKKWLDELNMEVPTTLDELKTVLQAFKDNDMAAKVYGAASGSTVPLSCGFDQWCWGQNIFYSGFGFTNFNSDICFDLDVGSDGKAYFHCVQDNYRDAITYFHDWYAQGLMDIEMFSQTDSQYLAKCSQGYVGVATWWYLEELMGDYASDYVYLPPLSGPNGCNVNVMTAGNSVNSGQLSITKACKSPVNLLKFYDQWYTGENVMQLQYGPIGQYFTEKDDKGMWLSITEDEAQAKFGKSAGEVKAQLEVNGPKLILSDYYTNVFYMEDRAVERLQNLVDTWLPSVQDKVYYPVNVVFTKEELDDIDLYKPDFVAHVSEQEALWLRDGGPSDAEWEAYKQELNDVYAMESLLKVYQAAYDRYTQAEK